MNPAPRIACFFHDKERSYFDELHRHFGALGVAIWSYAQILPGELSHNDIREHLEQDELLLFLLSAALLASEECIAWLALARQRQQSGTARVVLIRVRPCVSNELPWLQPLDTLPRDGTTLSSLRPNIQRIKILAIVTQLHALTGQGPPALGGECAKPRWAVKRWLLLPAVCTLAAGLFLFERYIGEPVIRAWQDSQGRYNYEVTRISRCGECSGRLNGGTETPRWKCERSYVFPPQELVPPSLTFYCGTKKYEANFNSVPVRLECVDGD